MARGDMGCCSTSRRGASTDCDSAAAFLFYARLVKQGFGFFDNASFNFSYNGQREVRINQGGQGDSTGAITSQRERTNVFGFNFHVDKQFGEYNTFSLGGDVYRDKVSATNHIAALVEALTAQVAA